MSFRWERPTLDEILEQLFWFVVLCGIIPAISANMIFPHYWYHQYLMESNILPVITIRFPFYVSIAAVVFIVGYAIKTQRYDYMIPIAAYLSLTSLDISEFGGSYFSELIYSLASFAVFIHFIAKAHIQKLYFPLFLVLLLFLLVWQPVFGSFQVLEFLFFVFVGKVIAKFLTENLSIFRSLGWRKSVKVAGEAFYYWSLMLIPLAIGFAAHFYFEQAVENEIYAQGIVIQTPRPADLAEGEPWDRNFRRDLDYTVDTQFARSEAEIGVSLNAASLDTEEGRKAFPDLVVDEFNRSVPSTIVDPGSCSGGILGLICREIKHGVNRAYGRFIDRQRAKLRAQATEIANDTSMSAQDKIAAMQGSLHDAVAETRRAAKLVITNSYRGWGFLNLFLNFLLLFAIVKSFLIVMARVVFTRRHDEYVTLSEDSGRMAKGVVSVPNSPQRYGISKSARGRFFNNNAIDWAGPPQRKAIPQWHSSVGARLRNGTYIMNEMVMGQPGSESAVFTISKDSQFVEWVLKKGEEVIFDHRYLVAISDTVRLRTILSMRIATLLLGRMFFTSASGPGKLVLITTGDAIVGKTRTATMAAPATRLVAWHRKTRFEVRAEMRFSDIYFSEVSIKKQPNDLIIINSKSPKKRIFGQLFRFVRVFILPF